MGLCRRAMMTGDCPLAPELQVPRRACGIGTFYRLHSDDDDDESHSELWEWLPQTLGIRSQHPRVYSHIRAILRNVMRDLKQLKAYLASVGLGGKSVKKKEEKGASKFRLTLGLWLR